MTENQIPSISTRYKELKREFVGERTFDVVMAFGHSPIKPLLLPEELSVNQKQEWDTFISHPLQGNEQGREPEFRVLGGAYLQGIRDIQARTDVDDSAKSKLIIEERIKLQHTGRLVLNRISRVNALAAGLALYLGMTDKLILSGAGTIPRKVSGDTVQLPQEVFDHTPSEAEMMKDIIVRTFGRPMFERDVSQETLRKKYSETKKIDVDSKNSYETFLEQEYQNYLAHTLQPKFTIEGKSVNTLENFSEILKLRPNLKTAALIAPGFHTERLRALAKLHSIDIEPFGALRDADLLMARAQSRGKKLYLQLLDYMNDPLRSPEQEFRVVNDNKWFKALIESKRIGYWLGYITELDLERLQNVIDMLNTSVFQIPAREAFVAAGLDFDEYTQKRLNELPDEKLIFLRIKLKEAFHGKGKPLREEAVVGL